MQYKHPLHLTRGSSRRGSTIVIFALVMGALLGIAGLVLDGGYAYFERRRAQVAADAAAYAGALEILHDNRGWITESARDDAAVNGYDDQSPIVSVTVHNPPTSGPAAGNGNAVEVIVEREMPTSLMKMVGRRSVTVRARAVAGVTADFSDLCVLALNPEASGAITVSGTATLNAPNCEIVTNSTASDAIVANGGGCINGSRITYGTGQGTAGGYSANGQNCLNPEPIGGIPRPDPYQSLTAVEPNPSDYPNQLQGGGKNGLKITGNEPQPVVLQPGYYPGGISITGGEVQLAPGTYVVDGFTTNGNVTLYGNGVTIFNTGANKGQISIAGGAQLNLSAPNDPSNPYNNILFWNSSTISCKNANQCDARINGSSDSVVDGVLYFPTVKLTYAGVQTTDNFTQIIADTLELTGTTYTGTDWASSGRTPTAQRVSFVE
jgi:hypothetical protein